MGKGEIVSNLGDGRYSVKLLNNRENADKALARIINWISMREEQIAALPAGDPEHKLPMLKLSKAALEKQKEYLEKIPADQTVSAWCADLSTELSGIVATIEINGDPDRGINIRPGYADDAVHSSERDGQAMHIRAMTPEQAFYNLAMLPGWQKWMPTYRYGTITSLTGDVCDIALDTAASAAQGLNVNQSIGLSAVPIEYMDCNGDAFEVGDGVLVQFTGRQWSGAKVIGFKENPKPCADYAVFIVHIESKAKVVALVWDVNKNSMKFSPRQVDDAAYVAWMSATAAVGQPLYSEEATCGRTAMTASSEPSDWPPEPGLMDMYAHSESNIFLEECPVGDLYDRSASINLDIQAAGRRTTGPGAACPESAYVEILLPGSPMAKTGFRTHKEYGLSKSQIDSWNGTDVETAGSAVETDVWHFYGPLGIMDTFNGTGDHDGDVYFQWDLPYAYTKCYVPPWQGTTNPDWTPEKNAAYSRLRYGRCFNGQYSDRSIVNVCALQYVPCTESLSVEHCLFEEWYPSWTFGSRATHIQAQSLFFEDDNGSTGKNFLSLGRSAALEAQLVTAVEMAYSLNGIPDKEVQKFQISVGIVKAA